MHHVWSNMVLCTCGIIYIIVAKTTMISSMDGCNPSWMTYYSFSSILFLKTSIVVTCSHMTKPYFHYSYSRKCNYYHLQLNLTSKIKWIIITKLVYLDINCIIVANGWLKWTIILLVIMYFLSQFFFPYNYIHIININVKDAKVLQ